MSINNENNEDRQFLVDTRQFYPVVQDTYTCCSIIEDFGGPQSVFHQNAAWQTIFDLGLWKTLQGFYGRGCQNLIAQGLISGDDSEDRLHRQTIFIEWDTDDEEVEGLPAHMPALYRSDDEDLDDYNERLCNWLSDSTGWCVMDWQYIPQAVEAGSDGEYYLQNIREDELQGYVYPHTTIQKSYDNGYVDVDSEYGILLIAKGYAFGNGSKALRVWEDAEDGRKYICLSDTIVYLENIGPEIKGSNIFEKGIDQQGKMI